MMTVIEALDLIKRNLESIPVKIGDMMLIGNPIFNAAHDIGEVIKALENAEREAKEKAEGEHDADYQNE